ncbi:MAG: ATP-binding protein, partial [Chloroflexota bacterium]
EEPLRARLNDRDHVQHISLGRQSSVSVGRLDWLRDELALRMTFDSFNPRGNRADATGQESLERALRAAKVFAQDPSGWLLFAGPTGCGKTHLAVAIVNARKSQGKPGLFAFVPDLLDYLRFSFSPQSPVTYDQVFEEVRTAPLLVLDDLGAQSSTPWAEEKLYQIIVYRQETRLPTVITLREYVENLPEAVQSRLKDVSLVNWVPIAAPDYRDSGARRGSRDRSDYKRR